MNLVPPRALDPEQVIKHELVQLKLCSPQDKYTNKNMGESEKKVPVLAVARGNVPLKCIRMFAH